MKIETEKNLWNKEPHSIILRHYALTRSQLTAALSGIASYFTTWFRNI